jgi:N-acetyl-alpha-D-muramate 1-phosphate uridylyltransferase
MVIYGDSYLDTSYAGPWKVFQRTDLPALMTVHRNEGRWDQSNVEFSEGVIKRYDKVLKTSAMQYIDYGLGVFSQEALLTWSLGESFDLAQLYGSLAQRGLLAGFEIHERSYEIGSSAGLVETDRYLRARSSIDPRR